MLNHIRVYVISVAVFVATLTQAIAKETDAFSQCPPEWQTYVSLTENFNSSFPQFSRREFLFVDLAGNVHNCLKERFSDNFLQGLENYLSNFRQMAGDQNTDLSCSVTQVTKESDRYYAVWIPEHKFDDEIKDCRKSISRVLTIFVNDGTF